MRARGGGGGGGRAGAGAGAGGSSHSLSWRASSSSSRSGSGSGSGSGVGGPGSGSGSASGRNGSRVYTRTALVEIGIRAGCYDRRLPAPRSLRDRGYGGEDPALLPPLPSSLHRWRGGAGGRGPGAASDAQRNPIVRDPRGGLRSQAQESPSPFGTSHARKDLQHQHQHQHQHHQRQQQDLWDTPDGLMEGLLEDIPAAQGRKTSSAGKGGREHDLFTSQLAQFEAERAQFLNKNASLFVEQDQNQNQKQDRNLVQDRASLHDGNNNPANGRAGLEPSSSSSVTEPCNPGLSPVNEIDSLFGDLSSIPPVGGSMLDFDEDSTPGSANFSRSSRLGLWSSSRANSSHPLPNNTRLGGEPIEQRQQPHQQHMQMQMQMQMMMKQPQFPEPLQDVMAHPVTVNSPVRHFGDFLNQESLGFRQTSQQEEADVDLLGVLKLSPDEDEMEQQSGRAQPPPTNEGRFVFHNSATKNRRQSNGKSRLSAAARVGLSADMGHSQSPVRGANLSASVVNTFKS